MNLQIELSHFNVFAAVHVNDLGGRLFEKFRFPQLTDETKPTLLGANH